MNIETYLREQTQLSMRQLASKAGLNHSTLSRRLKGDRSLTLETLRDISLATNLDFLDLAIRAELITKEHAKEIRGRGSLELASDEALLDELQRRLEQGADLNKYPPVFPTDEPLPPIRPLRKKREATREERARAALAEELEKDDRYIAAYRHRDGDELDYDSYH